MAPYQKIVMQVEAKSKDRYVREIIEARMIRKKAGSCVSTPSNNLADKEIVFLDGNGIPTEKFPI